MLTCTRLISRFFSNAHHHGSLPQQLGVVWDQLLKTDPEGPTLISHAAYPHDWSVHDELLSVCACSTLKPRKSKVSGRFLPCLAACRCANRPNSTSLVLVGSRVRPNFPSRLHKASWTRTASSRYWKHITKSSMYLIIWASPRNRGLTTRSNHRSRTQCS